MQVPRRDEHDEPLLRSSVDYYSQSAGRLGLPARPSGAAGEPRSRAPTLPPSRKRERTVGDDVGATPSTSAAGAGTSHHSAGGTFKRRSGGWDPVNNPNDQPLHLMNSEQLCDVVTAARGVMYRCRVCPYSSKTRSNVVTHAKLHTGEKPWACRLCPYATHISSNLTKHERTHIDQPSYQCRLCKYETVFTKDFMSHETAHVLAGEAREHDLLDASGLPRIDLSIAGPLYVRPLTTAMSLRHNCTMNCPLGEVGRRLRRWRPRRHGW